VTSTIPTIHKKKPQKFESKSSVSLRQNPCCSGLINSDEDGYETITET
jgi:hypothetical protein